MNRWKKAGILGVAIVLVLSAVACGGVGSTNVKAQDLNIWIETKQKSERDGKLYPVEYRITAVDRDPVTVEKRIQEYNVSARGSTLGQLGNDKLEYAIADYEVHYPVDFPDDEFGITSVLLPFSIVGKDGKENIKVGDTNYKGLTDTWEISPPPMGYDFYAGSTYEGAFVFVMVKGSADYLFKEGYQENGKDVIHYVKGK